MSVYVCSCDVCVCVCIMCMAIVYDKEVNEQIDKRKIRFSKSTWLQRTNGERDAQAKMIKRRG